MAIEVRIPTILRTYTGGAKQVEGTGATLGELIVDLEAIGRVCSFVGATVAASPGWRPHRAITRRKHSTTRPHFPFVEQDSANSID